MADLIGVTVHEVDKQETDEMRCVNVRVDPSALLLRRPRGIANSSLADLIGVTVHEAGKKEVQCIDV